jgi:CRISPR-associated endonuclease Csn1
MKKILGLDLGTNSIGWALIEHDFEKKQGEILGLGSRIIPMSQDILNKFDAGQSISQTAERTSYRGIRRLRERHLLRRERLHRVLNILGFLPEHYAKSIDFENNPGQFFHESEVKIAYNKEFIFKNSFELMMSEFKEKNTDIGNNGIKIPYDWTIYYLRKKAINEKINKEELAWILLNFNQKRGYYQLRGEEIEEDKPNKLVEFHNLKVINVEETGEKKGNDSWYNVYLENGWIYRRTSNVPIFDWTGKEKEFIVTTDLNDDGTEKLNKAGNPVRSFRAPKEEDWQLQKKKTEFEIDQSNNTVGAYIYNSLIQNPKQKIRGNLIRTIERKYYKKELEMILRTQIQYHSELQDKDLYSKAIHDLYPNNFAHRNNIEKRGFEYLFIEDILFYQRPLKTKKSQISKCKFETRSYINNEGVKEIVGINGIPKTHPLFQEFRLWQWMQNLAIFKREAIHEGKTVLDFPVTEQYLTSEQDYEKLFEFLNQRKEIKQDALLKYFGINSKTHRWNYIDDLKKTYPCNETRALINSRLSKIENTSDEIFTKEIEEKLWHILYSVEDKAEFEKALKKFAEDKALDKTFVNAFMKFPRLEKEYGAYSAKAIKKLLPLMRLGKYWAYDQIDIHTKERIDKIIHAEYDEAIKDRVREKAINLTERNHFKGLPLWLASYIVYDRHSETENVTIWKTPEDIDKYLSCEFTQHSLRNPIVEQIVTETLRVVKDIWLKLGNSQKDFFDEIHVELGRELKNNADERAMISKIQLNNENTNHRIRVLLNEFANDPEIEDVRPYSPYQHETLKIFEDGINNSKELPVDIEKISKLSNPSKNEITRYKAWLEQGYRSPYTGDIIPLNKLFTTAYQIEHIIPQSRFFDDAFSNKVICESEINALKGNMLGYEFIQKHGGEKIELSNRKYTQIFNKEDYENFIKKHYQKNNAKKQKLLLLEIPEKFAERQMNDTRYISKMIMALLSNIVRQENENDPRAKKIIPCTGAITAKLKNDWGFNDIWNDVISPRFKRMNVLHEKDEYNGPFGYMDNIGGNKIFRSTVPLDLLDLKKGFSKKRIDHRHHALDAVIIACATANHVNYINNENHIRKGKSKEEKRKIRYDLKNKLRRIERIQRTNKHTGEIENIDVAREFLKPWSTITQEVKKHLLKTIASHKQNIRIINKTQNRYMKYEKLPNGTMKKKVFIQEKGDHWAIRKPLHKETVYGKVSIKTDRGKWIPLNRAIETPAIIIDVKIRKSVKEKKKLIPDIKQLKKYFSENPIEINGKQVSKVAVWEWFEGTASRENLDVSFNEAKIKRKVGDTAIQKILLKHLNSEKYQNQLDANGKVVPPETLAFSQEGILDMNKNILTLNDGKFHQPIKKVRIWEEGNRFPVGEKGNKKDKFVEAQKGTNLFFAIYENEDGIRVFETIPLTSVIEHQKQMAENSTGRSNPIPLNPELGNFKFALSPNDLVYVPTQEEMENPDLIDFSHLGQEQVNRIYKCVSFSKSQCFFIHVNIATSIQNKFEFSALNKMEKTIEGEMIKEICWKLEIDRLGKIRKVFE